MNNYGSFLSPPNRIQYTFKKLNTERNINARVSGTRLTSMVSKVKYSVDFYKILTSGSDFEELLAFPHKSSKAVIRITPSKRMAVSNYSNLLEEWENVNNNSTPKNSTSRIRSIRVKFKDCTVVFYKTYFDIFGVDAWDLAKDHIIHNGWATETLREKLVEFQSINGKFSLGRRVNLEKFAQLSRASLDGDYTVLFGVKEKKGKGRAKMLERTNANERGMNFSENEGMETSPVPQKELVKRKVDAVVIKYKPARITYQVFSSGIVLFSYPGIGSPEDVRNFFVKILFRLQYAFTNQNAGEERANRHAERYPIARVLPRTGEFSYKIGKESFTVKPPNGFYIRPGTNGKPRLYMWKNMKFNRNIGWTGNKKLTLTKKNATIVAKAFANAKVNIPNHTRRIFKNEFGLNLELPSENKKVYANTSNRRAPSWNAVKPGFYVRPGPGKQPYWAAIPAGINAGRKTVIKRYTDAGVNIPQTVRNIFKIGVNVKTEGNRKHNVMFGENNILRINGRQVTRLTIPELVAIAHNLGIPQVNSKTNKQDIIKFIQNKHGLVSKQEARETAAKAKAKERVKAKKEEKEASKAAATSRKRNNMELLYGKKLMNTLGKKFKNGDLQNFMKEYNKIHGGLRGNPLKANVEKAFRAFVNNIKVIRRSPVAALTQKQKNVAKRLQQRQFVGAAAQVERM